MCILVSCETGGERLPPRFVAGHAASTRGDSDSTSTSAGTSKPVRVEPATDLAARHASRSLARSLKVPLIENEFAPGLIDVARSTHHRRLFPSVKRTLSAAERDRLLCEIYRPYREKVRQQIETLFVRNRYVIHLAVTTFAASSGGKPRRADVGLGYDPRSDDEVDFCLEWIDELYDLAPMVRIRRNYPRRGTADSLTKAMRAEFADRDYLGIELQLNRAWAAREIAVRDEVLHEMAEGLREITCAAHSDAA